MSDAFNTPPNTSSNLDEFFGAISAEPTAPTNSAPTGYYETFFPETQGALKPEDSGAPLRYTQIPTSSSFSARPRTLAAWWEKYPDEKLGDLIVIFRDGTPWVYEEVSEMEWEKFKGEISKGTWIAFNGDMYNNYKASDISLPANVIIRPEDSYRGPRNSNQIARPWTWKRGNEALKINASAERMRRNPRLQAKSASTHNVSASKPNTSAKGPRKKK